MAPKRKKVTKPTKHVVATTTTASNIFQTSRLLSLPPELRNRDYGMVFGGHVQKIEYNKKIKHYTVVPAILLACRQIHDEAAGMYYSSTIFIAEDKLWLKWWLRNLSPQRVGLLQEVHYQTPDSTSASNEDEIEIITKLLSLYLRMVRRALGSTVNRALRPGVLKIMVLCQSKIEVQGVVLRTSDPESDGFGKELVEELRRQDLEAVLRH